jgi:5-methyltetrahydropteroyltriglutamate--homocysteine methyltransferase
VTDLNFLTHEIGSLAKPPWLVKTSQGRDLDPSDVEHARAWGEKVGVEGHEELVESLERGDADPDEVARWSSRYCVRLQESAGLDVIWDGEQQRSEMYAWAIAHANGFEPRGTVRSFDNKYYS